MKTKLAILVFILLTGSSGFFETAKSCNNSSLSLVSITTAAGPVYTVTVSLCIGYGRTGTTFGAEGATADFFSFAVFRGAGTEAQIQAALTSFTPTAIGPPLPGHNFTGMQAGPGFNINEKDNIYYYDATGNSYQIACVSSTVDCGDPGSWCKNFVFVYNGIKPDSIRAIGIEGLAPYGGCWQHPDMVVNLSTLPVIWGDFSGATAPAGNTLTWTTLQEHNSKHFILTRSSGNAGLYTEIGRVNATGLSSQEKTYNFFDPNPSPGLNHYRVIIVNQDERLDNSESVSLNYSPAAGLSLQNLYPVPANQYIAANLLSDIETDVIISLWSLDGQKIDERKTKIYTGTNQLTTDISTLPPGIYIWKLQAGAGLNANSREFAPALEKQFIIQ